MSDLKTKVYIALGSNIEPKSRHLKLAIENIHSLEDSDVVEVSNVYQTVPKGYTDQDDFLNMVISVETGQTSSQLIKSLQEIESELKRIKTIKNGPRTIDLDILMFGDEIIRTDDLIVPHPRLHERAFVLFPFAEIAGEVNVPTLNKTIEELRDSLPEKEQRDVEIKDKIENVGN